MSIDDGRAEVVDDDADISISDDADILEQYEGDGLTWTVYRAFPDGEPIPRGAKASGTAGPYVTRLQGKLSLEALSRAVGPGLWDLWAKRNTRIIKRIKVHIAGRPWPEEAFNRYQPAPLPPASSIAQPVENASQWSAPREAPAPVLDERNATFLRNEIRAAVASYLPPPGYPQAPPAAPVNQLELLNVAMQLAERMNANARPASDMTGLFETFVSAFESGIRQGSKIATGAPEQGGMTEMLRAVLPALLQGVPGLKAGPVTTAPPASRNAAPMPAPAAPDSSALAAPPSPVAPAAWGPRDFVLAALYRGIQAGAEVDHLCSALELYLDDETEFHAFVTLGEPTYTDDAIRGSLLGWAGPASPALDVARALASTETTGDVIRTVQLALLETVETVDDETDDDGDGGPDTERR